MTHASRSRSDLADLLARPPCTAQQVEAGWHAHFRDPLARLIELADLCERGLLSRDEFEGQKAKVFGQY